MRINNLCLGAVILVLGMLSCSKRDLSERVTLDNVNLIHKRSIMLALDSQTSSLSNFYQVVERDSSTLLLFFNSLNYHLYAYDLLDGKFVSKVAFEKDGPDGLGARVTSFKYLNDSSLIFHNYYGAELVHAKMSGKVSFRYRLRNDEFGFTPETAQNAPFAMMGETVFLYTGLNSNQDDLKIPMLLSYSLKDSSSISNTGITLPALYETSSKRYFPSQLSKLTLDENLADGLVVVSFPLEDSVQIVGKTSEISKKYFGSPQHILKGPLSKSGGPKVGIEKIKDFMRYSKYGSIKYDPYRDVYLRTFYKETPEKLLEVNKLRSEQSILFANDDLDMLGVAKFKGTDQLLFAREGMLEVVLSTSQEDSLKVRVYEYEF